MNARTASNSNRPVGEMTLLEYKEAGKIERIDIANSGLLYPLNSFDKIKNAADWITNTNPRINTNGEIEKLAKNFAIKKKRGG